ncbi:FAD-binding domain-containing protein [Falsiruegeria mediterranea]|uniref:Cryptochrome-like protein cry2 n=1 Tax=Falsiruegeria mediterranea M17 TaxID=1200281 RepID=A0A2R8C4R6_9RHOB|nr:FAD-binding domain-containing protein [Falsiruegeria mediterranea]SPJ27356.1 Cryptochrome-like protein cry2 [Falsiruegeria mediterranea M17]
MTVICWFKKDLRVHDHAALARAAELGPVLPVYVLEPALWQQPDMSGRQFAFLRESLRDLHRELAEVGLTLCVRVGDAVQELEALRQETGAQHMVSHEETGNAWTFARDRAVADWARSQGVQWQELAQSGVIRRMNGRDGWAKKRNAYLRNPLLSLPAIQGITATSHPWPDLLQDDCPSRQWGGRQEGLLLLGGFLTERGRTYRKAMSSPLEGATACSRLSPHLAFGTLSGREVAQATAVRQREITGGRTGWSGSLKSFQARLAWRDHFIQKLEDEPPLEWQCLHPAYEGLREDDATRRQAWAEGQTGLPFVDACMRSLAATGWLNFRMRSMVMAVASYHLWLDWRATGQHLARMFTDYEPGIHWPQVQMQSGTTGMNTIRIYNPVKQGHDQDPTGAFTRRWVPELREVPDEFLQEPWKWEGATRLRYPQPLVEPQTAARHAREGIWAVRKGQGFRDTAHRLVDRHASRKRPPRPAKTRQTRVDQRQLGFDF